MASSWAKEYIGNDWIAGENDCWSFARKIWRKHFNLDIAPVDVDPNNRLSCVRALSAGSKQWIQVQCPQEGDAVLMSTSKHPSHVGIWYEKGVLHSMKGTGVIYSSLGTLRVIGLKVCGYYRHESFFSN